MADDRITVSLSHDEWQWVMSLVLNSAYLRARPIVVAVEAAVAAHGEAAKEAVFRDQNERQLIMQELRAREADLATARQGLRELNTEKAKLERRLRGYQGAEAKRARRANGADPHEERNQYLEAALRDSEGKRQIAEDLVADIRGGKLVKQLQRQLDWERTNRLRAQSIVAGAVEAGYAPPPLPGTLSEIPAPELTPEAQAELAEVIASDANG